MQKIAQASPPENSAKQFTGAVAKFSIAAYVNLGITALNMLLTSLLLTDKSVYGDMNYFIQAISLISFTGMLGLDKSLIRFFKRPPEKITSAALFRICLYFSCAVLIITGLICTVFSSVLMDIMKFSTSNLLILVPALFFASFLWAIARIYNVLYRMQEQMVLFTLQSISTMFCFRLFYFVGAFFKNQFEAMVLFLILGLAIVSLVFIIVSRKILLPQKGDIKPGVLKTILPYGLYNAPTTIILYLNSVLSLTIIGSMLGGDAKGIYGFGTLLGTAVTTIQAGFATFWGGYMFANYKTQQERIKKVHDILNLIILVFFALIIAFEDIIFVILPTYKETQQILPLMMMASVFSILCEGTAYGIEIAKRPFFDTIAFACSLIINLVLCVWLIPLFGLTGAAAAFATSNGFMFLVRTLIAQKFYRTIRYPAKTAVAIIIGIMLAAVATFFSASFVVRLAASFVAIATYCILYKTELLFCIRTALNIAKGFLNKKQPEQHA